MRNSAAKAAAAALAAARSAAARVATVTTEPEASVEDSAQPSPTDPAAQASPARPAAAQAAGAAPTSATQPTSSQHGTPRPAAAQPSPARTVADPGVRRVRLVVSRIDPWSVMKLSFILAFALGIMVVVATAMFWGVLNGLGVFTQIQELLSSIVGTDTKSQVDILQYVAFDRVIALAALIAIVNLVLMTAIATIIAFIYNIVAAVVGGIHLTLTDE